MAAFDKRVRSIGCLLCFDRGYYEKEISGFPAAVMVCPGAMSVSAPAPDNVASSGASAPLSGCTSSASGTGTV